LEPSQELRDVTLDPKPDTLVIGREEGYLKIVIIIETLILPQRDQGNYEN
jgi:hypothetical protein